MWCYESTSVSLRLAIFAIALAAAAYCTARHWRIPALRRTWRRLAGRPVVCAALVFGTSLLLSIILTATVYPQPWIHDEGSYLLAADTFAHGRLTNPAHPMWVHFEPFHALSGPTYMSKYPPGNAMFLALGQVSTGHPIVGVWFALALGHVALYWMLRAWLPPKWALLGGLLAAVHVPMLLAWGQTYWGGAVQLTGGALVFGAVRRILARPTVRDGTILGVGAAVLAISRPFEGLLVCLIVGGLLAVWFIRRGEVSLRDKLIKIVVPVCVTCGLGGAALLAYNASVTGKPLKLPYSLHSQSYKASALAWWSPLPEVPHYNHERIERYYLESSRARHAEIQTVAGYSTLAVKKLELLWKFFPIAGGVCLLTWPLMIRRRWVLFAACVVVGILLLHLQLATTLAFPHYLAPLAGLFYFLSLAGLRYWTVIGRRKPWCRAIPCAVVVYAALHVAVFVGCYHRFETEHPRAKIESRLAETAGKHLVIVSYAPNYTLHNDWVYNRADIDGSRIVWARDMGSEKNAQLVDYFRDRRVWQWDVRANDDHDLTAYAADGPPPRDRSSRPRRFSSAR